MTKAKHNNCSCSRGGIAMFCECRESPQPGDRVRVRRGEAGEGFTFTVESTGLGGHGEPIVYGRGSYGPRRTSEVETIAVCPRCLDIEPGTPGGDPATPHPGPFTHDLCSPCEERSGR